MKMKKRLFAILLAFCVTFTMMPLGTGGAAYAAEGSSNAAAPGASEEPFVFTIGETYYFDLANKEIPGTVNNVLPDTSLHYVPFTYVGMIDSYSLTDADQDSEEMLSAFPYKRPLFIAEHNVMNDVSWKELYDANVVFMYGKNCMVGNSGLGFYLRTPTGGSKPAEEASRGGIPQGNEWDAILQKDASLIKNDLNVYSWCQDMEAGNSTKRALRANGTAAWKSEDAEVKAGYRPVLEGSYDCRMDPKCIKELTLNLGGGTLNGSAENIKIVIESKGSFKAPAQTGLSRPENVWGNYFRWRDENGNLYEPGQDVSAEVSMLTAQWAIEEQLNLTLGATYYFDLSGELNFPDWQTNQSLPDTSFKYVPFTYVGLIEAYKLEKSGETVRNVPAYKHNLFISDYGIANNEKWRNLDAKGLVFGKNYTSAGIDYQFRLPSVGNDFSTAFLGEAEPSNNEWDVIVTKASQDLDDKATEYIKNWWGNYSFGQDAYRQFGDGYRGTRGGRLSVRGFNKESVGSMPGETYYRPVLEVLNPDKLGKTGIREIFIDLNGGGFANVGEMRFAVQADLNFNPPDLKMLTRPEGNDGYYFRWKGSDGKLYAPYQMIPAGVSKLTAMWEYEDSSERPGEPEEQEHEIIVRVGDGIGDAGSFPNIAAKGREVDLIAIPDRGYQFKEWRVVYGDVKIENDKFIMPDSDVIIEAVFEPEKKEYAITVQTDGKGQATANPAIAAKGTEITLTAEPNDGYRFKAWEVISGNVTIENNKFLMPDSAVTVKAVFEVKSSGGSGGSSSGGSGGSYVPVQKPAILAGEGSHTTLSADGTKLSITAADGYEITDVLLNGTSKGSVTELSELKTGDKVEIKTAKKADNPPSDDASLSAVNGRVSKMLLSARSSKTPNKNIKLVLKLDEKTAASIESLKKLGYTVKYKFYRSTKKSSAYKAKITQNAGTYINTNGKKGARYYYKARILVYDKNGKLVAQTELKQCKYACRVR